ncbi:Mov34/MPN/PAD-1 family protein [Halioglobus pacificus]|uniref:Mov34/MPN/PAD-1 family protein n=1 Tax=Parahalioglobus pacificus TaxID=930806 RepID=UPI0016737527|nr:Mov34/MPN/PAD-1 family protein [Halioglobus pacificus]
MIFKTENEDLTVELSKGVLDHLAKNRQLRVKDKEAGGQLFARLFRSNKHWLVEMATGPHRRDLRTRFGFRPNRKKEQQDIDAAFNDGLHFVGDWHTHPEPFPRPSNQDKHTMSDIFDKSDHQLRGFLMIILGNGDLEDLWISIHGQSGNCEPLLLQ